MQSLKELLEAVSVPVVLAVFGGLARACRFGVKSWKHFAGSMVVSAFTGVLVHLLLSGSGLSPSVMAAIVAASGYSGGIILDALVQRLVRGVEEFRLDGTSGNITPGSGVAGGSGSERREGRETGEGGGDAR